MEFGAGAPDSFRHRRPTHGACFELIAGKARSRVTSPVTCDHNSTIYPKMKCTFCTNYLWRFLVKPLHVAQDSAGFPSYFSCFFAFLFKISAFLSLYNGFFCISHGLNLIFSGVFRHFCLRRFAQLAFFFFPVLLSVLSGREKIEQ
jgi:hypothetical protein